MTVMALAVLMVSPGFSADKLIVKDSSGNNTKFVVRDDGSVGINNPTALGYVVDVSAGNNMKSSLHFSLNGTDTGGWITSVLDNNFFLSSGAMYNGAQGGWIQKSSDGSAIVAGSQWTGFEIWTATGTAVGSAAALTRRVVVSTNGNMGIGFTNPVQIPQYVLEIGNGAYVTPGGVWHDASSRDYKENIQSLSTEKALEALKDLTPVTYNYKVDSAERHVGFIAEDVPELIASKDRKALSPMDIVAVLTKVVQEQSKTIEALSAKIDRIEKASKNNNDF